MQNRWTRNQKILAVGAFVGICTLFVQVRNLRHEIQPVIEMKPQIVNVINNITKVEKEVANLNEVIHQHYAAFETEVFGKSDIGQRMAVLPAVLPKDALIYFVLQKIPEVNSVQITGSSGRVAPANTYTVLSNIITLRRDIKVDGILEEGGRFYAVRYVPDAVSGEKIRNLQDIQEGN
jgi:hypothetical protein